MSFCAMPTVAAKIAVDAPTIVTTQSATGAYSNMGESRTTMNTPAVTMVAAWISAETGVGPSMASGNQVCSGTWADLPMAPTNSRRHSSVRVSISVPRNSMDVPAMSGEAANTASKETVSKTRKTPMMPSARPKSPMRLTMNALMAAALALGRLYQKPMSR